MAPPPKPETALITDVSDVFQQHLQIARRIKNAAANLDTSQSTPDSTVWPNLLQSQLTTLQTQEIILHYAFSIASPEVAQALESLRATNDTALASLKFGLKVIQDEHKVRGICLDRPRDMAWNQVGYADQSHRRRARPNEARGRRLQTARPLSCPQQSILILTAFICPPFSPRPNTSNQPNRP